MVYLATSINEHAKIEACARPDLTEHVRGSDLRDFPPIERWRNGPTAISIRLVDAVEMHREHIARLIRGHVDAEHQVYTGEDFAILRSGLSQIGDEWGIKRTPEEEKRDFHYCTKRNGDR